MNRQARLYGWRQWYSYGAVTFEQAAKMHAVDRGALGPTTNIEVRDEGSDVIRTLNVDRKVEYRVRGLRGGQ